MTRETSRTMLGTWRKQLTDPYNWLAAGVMFTSISIAVYVDVPAPFDRGVAFVLGVISMGLLLTYLD